MFISLLSTFCRKTFAAIMVAAALSCAHAATITINSAKDAARDGTNCTLKGAVQAINEAKAIGGCKAGDGSSDTIQFDTNVFSAPTTIGVGSVIEIKKNLILRGNNKITLDAKSKNQIFTITGGENLTIEKLTFKNAKIESTAEGGAIAVNTTDHKLLTVNNAIFSGNETNNNGGAIYSEGSTVKISDSYFDSNSAVVNGGAISAKNAVVYIRNSTFSNNISGGGSGGAVYAFELQASNSTFLHNSLENPAGFGGAIYSKTLKASQLTLVNNIAKTTYRGSSIYIEEGGDISNSLIAGTSNQQHCSGHVTGSYNIEWNNRTSNDQTCGSTFVVSVSASDITDIVSTTLKIQGGSTPTLALPPSSAAIDKANASSQILSAGFAWALATQDQRGSMRSPTPDIGAFEYHNFELIPAAGALAAGTEDVAYSKSFTASGAQSYQVTGGALPDGLTLSNTGVLKGKPTTAGTYSFVISATDSTGNVAGNNYTLEIKAAPLTLPSTTDLVTGTVNQAYNNETGTAAKGGTKPFTYEITDGALPDGVELNTSTGALTGTPTESGEFTFTITVTDSASPANSISKEYTLDIAAATAAFNVTPTTLSDATENQSYQVTFSSAGGSSPYKYVLQNTSPSWLTINEATGVLSGTPTSFGSATVNITVTDSSSPAKTVNVSLPLTIKQSGTTSGLTLAPSVLATGIIHQAYTTSLVAGGGAAPYSYAISEGPDWLGISSSGVLSGVPNATGVVTVTIKAMDSSSPVKSISRTYTLTINQKVVSLKNANLPTAMETQAFYAWLPVDGGAAPYSYSLTNAPSWMNISSNGVLSGTPPLDSAGSINITVRVVDNSEPVAQTASKTYTLKILARSATVPMLGGVGLFLLAGSLAMVARRKNKMR